MFNPSELEGEVDHSFFDSEDDGDSGLSRDTGKESLPERLQEKQMENTKAVVSPGSDVTRKQPKLVNSYYSKDEDRNRAFSLPIVPAVSNKVTNSSSDSEEDCNLPPKRQNRTFMALLAEATEVRDKDIYVTDEESSSSSAKHPGSKLKKKQSPKKLMRNRHVQSSSPTSTSSEDADSESCSSSYSGRSSSNSPTIPKSKKLSPGGRKVRLGSAESRDYAKESESMTDVSPLSSPDISPEQSLDLNHREEVDTSLKEEQQPREEGSVPSSGLSEIHPDDNSIQDVDRCKSKE